MFKFFEKSKAHRLKHDYTAEAEAMYRGIASDLGLEIIKEPDDPVELSMVFPVQDRLPVRVWVCLQNLDELWFVVDDFTHSAFPFEDVKEDFEATLRDFLSGQFYLRKFVRKTDGKVFKSQLLKNKEGRWKVYSTYRHVITLFPILRYETVIDKFNQCGLASMKQHSIQSSGNKPEYVRGSAIETT